nr:TonB-dependent receptor [Pleionea sp. CnH1-48]
MQKQSEAPAVISVITREDIKNWNYRSVADALQQVPGFYGVDDFVSVNFGVRGSNGGLRAYSRNLKVMINGQSVAFRSDSANFLGPELIAMEAVEQIEVVRGPASALYGENAFLGVVNIITRKAEDLWSGDIQVSYGVNSQQATSGWFGYVGEKTRLNAAFMAGKEERNSYQLPTTSPLYSTFVNANNLVSQNDTTRPRNIYFDLKHSFSDVWTIEGMFHRSVLDTFAEFIDFGILSHNNRISLETETARVDALWRYSDQLNFKVSYAHAWGEPGSNERLNFGSAVTFPRRKFAYDAHDIMIEGLYTFSEDTSLIFGFDNTNNNEELIEIFNVDSITGVETLVSQSQGRQKFENKGAYLQFTTYATEAMGVTLNLRVDDHNIYGESTNYRAGLVFSVTDKLSIKALYGTSFKAPAAMQLYAQPLYAGEIFGNPLLQAEEASTSEIELNWSVSETLKLVLNVYNNKIDNRVELIPVGNNSQPQNRGAQTGYGAEGEVHYRIHENHSLAANFAYTDTENSVLDPILGVLVSPSDMYPKLSTQIRWQWQMPQYGSVGISARYASERRATRSNIQFNDSEPYQLEPYTLLDAIYSYEFNSHALSLRMLNVLDEDYEQPGFSGIDVPGRERTLSVSYSFRF